MSGNQEVSAYDIGDTGDNWIIECLDKKSKKAGVWNRESQIRLKHVDTSKYLSSSTSYVFRNPIPGQLEVCAVKSPSDDTVWEAREGLYFAQVS
jgi:dolichyl-phosphate-mannose--protein O-mannosyl transferase